MVGFLALAIDLGMLAIAKTQVQQAADLAALTAARTLNGDATSNYNQSAATTNAQNVLTYNVVLGQPIQSSQLQLTYGSYDYNQTTQTFQRQFPADERRRRPPRSRPRSPRTACRPHSARSSETQFLPNVSATAQAVHRPRDIALVMDLSGSMRYGHLPRIRLLHQLAHHQQSRHPRPDVRPLFVEQRRPARAHHQPNLSYDSYTISPSNTTAAQLLVYSDIREQLLSERRLCLAP